MEYRRLGGSGLKVSEISLGTWVNYDRVEDKDGTARITDKAFECGINFFDTADAYSEGRAESILGTTLRRYPRESYVLATKVYWPTGKGPNDRGLSRKHIHEQVDHSLRRLGTEYIDLYYCHWFDLDTPVDETLRAMSDLVTRGRILYFGVSNWAATQITEGLRAIERHHLHPIVANQPSYNMFDRYIERETIPVCSRNGIGQVVYSPLAQGVLTGKYRRGAAYPSGSRATKSNTKAEVTVFDYLDDSVLARVDPLLQIAADLGVPLSRLALAWVLRQPNVSSALVGVSRPDQLEDNVKASGLHLPDPVRSRIEEVLRGATPMRHNVVAAPAAP